MTVITELADGQTEVFKTERYLISRSKEFHPLILKVTVFDNGKKIKTVTRPFKFFYKHFTFKTEKVQAALKQLEEQKKEKN